MWRKFCKFLLTKVMGWKIGEPIAPDDKCLILGVPHTSGWDLVVSYLYYKGCGGDSKVMIKNSFFVWPLSSILRALGGVPINRKSPAKAIIDIVDAYKENDKFQLAMCPEGTRKPIRRWKTGFHTIATKAGVPVYLGYFDWGTKTVGRGQKFELSDDPKADLEKIQAIYESMHLTGKHPENYLTH